MEFAPMAPDRIERLRRALAWITSEVDALGVPFQVAGGLAARAHGASRPLHDIDLYVPEGEQIELAEAARTRYRRDAADGWQESAVDFESPAIREVFGVEVPVMPRVQLIAYKERLDRPVDREDVAELRGEG